MPVRLTFAAAICLAILASWEVFVGFRQSRSNFMHFPVLNDTRLTVVCGAGVSIQRASIRTRNGSVLNAWYVRPGNRATIVLLHGTGASSASLTGDFCMFASAGFGVLAYDGPGYGESGGRIGWGEGERQAFSTAVRWLKGQPGQRGARIGAVGYSAGGFILACAAARDAGIDAIALAGTPGNFREQVVREVGGPGSLKSIGAMLALAFFHDASAGDPQASECVSQISPRPLLVIAGQNDPIVDPTFAEKLYRLAGAPKELWVVPGAAHVDYLLASGDIYRNHILRFFRDALLPAIARSQEVGDGTRVK